MAVAVYDSAALHRLLAHRYPFLLVDRVEVVESGRHVVGRKMVTAGEWWAEGNSKVELPFAFVIEAMAQTSGALIEGLTEGAPSAIAYFMAVDRVRPRNAAKVGDELTMDVTLRQWKRGICRTNGVARLQNGMLVASAELTTIVRVVPGTAERK